MTITAKLADGRILNFPDGTDPAIVQATVKNMLGVKVNQPTGNIDVPDGGQTSIAKPSDSTFLDEAYGVGEAALTAVTGATTGALGFGIGTLQDAYNQLTGKTEKGSGPVLANQYAEILTNTPESEEGKAIVKAMGENLGVLPPVLGITPKPLGFSGGAFKPKNIKLEALNARKTFGELLEPIGIAETAYKKGNIRTMRLPKDAGVKRKLIAEQTLSENPNINAVTKMVTDDGDIVTRPNSVKALKQLTKSVGEESATQTVSVIENMAKGSKRDFNDMLNIIQKGFDEPLFGQENRPSDILGRAAAQRARDINKLNETARNDIGRIARTELVKDTFDISGASKRLFDDLEKMGFSFDTLDDGSISANSSRAKFVGGNKELIDKVVNFASDTKQNGLDVHELKQFTRELVDYGAGTESAMSNRSQAPFKDFANGINDILVNANKNYGKANDKFSKTIDIKDSFNRYIKGVDVNSELANQSLANKMRRLVSNAESRTPIKNLLNESEAVLKEYGKTYDNNINQLNYAVTKLEDAFKITPAASLQGNLQRAGANLAQGMSPELAVGRTLMDKVFSLGESDFKKTMKTYRLLAEKN